MEEPDAAAPESMLLVNYIRLFSYYFLSVTIYESQEYSKLQMIAQHTLTVL